MIVRGSTLVVLVLLLPAARADEPSAARAPRGSATDGTSARVPEPISAAESSVEYDRLIRLLARARRIDPGGQQLLRRRAFLKRLEERCRLSIAELESKPAVRSGRAIAGRQAVQSRLQAISELAPDNLETAYRALLKELNLSDLVMDDVAHLVALEQRADKVHGEIAETERDLIAHEESAPISLRPVLAPVEDDWQIVIPEVSRPKDRPVEVDSLMQSRLVEIVHTLSGGKK